jgi:hypothetical protein
MNIYGEIGSSRRFQVKLAMATNCMNGAVCSVVEHLVYTEFGRFSRPLWKPRFTRENGRADRKSSCLKYGAIQHVQYEIEYEIWSRWRNWRSAIGSRVVKWRAMHRRESKSPMRWYAPNGVLDSRGGSQQPCQLAVFSSKLPSMEQEIDCRLQPNSH